MFGPYGYRQPEYGIGHYHSGIWYQQYRTGECVVTLASGAQVMFTSKEGAEDYIDAHLQSVNPDNPNYNILLEAEAIARQSCKDGKD